MDTKNLQRKQLEEKIKAFQIATKVAIPPTGWIKAIRLALNITLEQLGKKMSVSKQGIGQLESREQEGTITLKTLRETAEALEMKLVYGFVPKDGSLDAFIERKAYELAYRIVMRTSNTMTLEDQENSDERIKMAIQQRAIQIKHEMPKMLWD